MIIRGLVRRDESRRRSIVGIRKRGFFRVYEGVVERVVDGWSPVTVVGMVVGV